MNHMPARLKSSGPEYHDPVVNNQLFCSLKDYLRGKGIPRMKCVPAKTGASSIPTRKRRAYSCWTFVTRLCAKVQIPQRISRVGSNQRALPLRSASVLGK